MNERKINWKSAQRIRAWENVDRKRFNNEILPLHQPAVLKGLADQWPAVRAARESPRALCDYLRTFSTGNAIEAFSGAAEIKGRFSYSEDLRSFNFEKRQYLLSDFLDLLLAHLEDDSPPSLYAGAIKIPQHAPQIIDENNHHLLAASVEQLASLWIGNRTRTAAHFDLPQNIACIIGGRRRFVLLPIEQLQNLYVGPIDFTLAGQAISLVDFHEPDFERHPRFREAIPTARVAELGPGDGLYIPSLWWHHVETLDPLGVLLNFWWRDAPEYMFTPMISLLHSLLSIRELPEHEREAWRVVFDHYLFQTNGNPVAHLPTDVRGVLGEMTPARVMQLRRYLADSLNRQ